MLRTGCVLAVMAATATVADAHPRIFDYRPPAPDHSTTTGGVLDREGFSVGGYAGMQSVRAGGDAWSAELTLRAGRFSLRGAMTRFDGVRAGDARLPTSPIMRTLEDPDARVPTLASLTFGMRLDDGGPWRVLAEGGIARAVMYTDPVLDEHPVGGIASLRVDRMLHRRISAFVEGALMGFYADIHATHLRFGARIGPVEASFRRLAFNEGLPLYGPELGLRF